MGLGAKLKSARSRARSRKAIEPLRESSRGLRVLVGAGEHPGPREDFSAGILFALSGGSTGTDAVRSGIELDFLLRQFLLQLALLFLVVFFETFELFRFPLVHSMSGSRNRRGRNDKGIFKFQHSCSP